MATRPPPDWFDGDDAQQLLRHLEWQPEGFSLLFLFADAQPAQWLADWLNTELRPAGLPLQQPACAALLAHDPDALVEALMAELTTLQAAPGAVWLPMLAHPQQPDWDAARRKLLARLNERRFLLERDLPRPLLLVLPANFRPITREIAPDIWHIRVLSQQWHAPALTAALDWCWQKLPAGFPISWDRQPWMGRAEDAEALLREWRRSQQNENKGVMLATGWQAVASLVAIGKLAEAKNTLFLTLKSLHTVIRKYPHIEYAKPYMGLMFQLITLAIESEKWDFAADSCGKQLELHENVHRQYSDSCHDFLGIDRYNLGVVNYRRGCVQDSCHLYCAALNIFQNPSLLISNFIRYTAQSNITYGQARIAASSCNHTAALSTYQVSLAHYQQAIASNPASASALQRDLALIQLGLADAHMGLQDWPAAEQALANSVALFRQLAAAPRAPRHAREDLAIALARQALLPPGDLAPLQEAEDLLLQLRAEFVEVPAYPRELNAVRELQSLVAVSSCYAD